MKTGLVLAGGGLKGSYQVGSYFAFKKCHVKIDGVVGTSIGAFNAALIASHKENELLDFWKNIDVGTILGIDPEVIKLFNGGYLNYDALKKGVVNFKDIILNKGLKTDELRNIANKMIDKDKLLKTDMDFGLATLNFSDLKPEYLYKEDIEKNKIVDSLIASCYLPVFKMEPIINNKMYLDGGFFDNCPSIMLINKGYNKIYEVKIKGIGLERPINKNKYDITTISPSRENGSIFELNKTIILDNIKMGYYDTLRVLKKYAGYKFCFYPPIKWLVSFRLQKLSVREKNRAKSFFRVKDDYEMIIKCLEYIMDKEHVDYYQVYNYWIMAHKLSKIKSNDFRYNIIKKISIF